MSNKFLQAILLLIAVLILKSCANINPPTGGNKDTKPPKLKSSSPRINQTNFHGNRIEMEFDEDINSQTIQEQLIITPLMENEFKINARRNRLSIIFEKPFDTNTTYTLNFRESLKDNTEGNIASAMSFSFSTGKYLDSNSISGTVKRLNTNTPMTDVIVGLYPIKDSLPDTIIAKKAKPTYFTKTKNTGTYTINNVKTGKYQLIAINDANNNLLFNDNELLAIDAKIEFDTTSKIKRDLNLSKYISILPDIKNIKEAKNVMEVRLKEPVDTFTYNSDSKINFYPTLSSDKKTVYLYRTEQTEDSITANLFLKDSVDNTVNKPFKFKFTSNEKLKKEPIILTVLTKDKVRPTNQALEFSTSKPIVEINTDSIFLKKDSIIVKIQKENVEQLSYTKFKIKKDYTAKDSLILILKSGFIKSYDTISTEQKIQFGIKREEDYSLMEIAVKTKEPNYLIQLLTDKYEIVDEQRNIKTHTYYYVNPGSYYLRAIIDTNNNGKWDPGNLIKNTPPEPIIFLNNKLELRANWEVRDVVFEF